MIESMRGEREKRKGSLIISDSCCSFSGLPGQEVAFPVAPLTFCGRKSGWLLVVGNHQGVEVTRCWLSWCPYFKPAFQLACTALGVF